MQISKTLYERLHDASKRNVLIKIIYGKDDLKPNQKNSLSKLKNLELLYFKNLHAKCYFNEQEMVITSMNMYEFSEKNNREMGVFVTLSNDKKLFDNAVSETNSIIESSELVQLSKTKQNLLKAKRPKIKIKQQKGYCIRCEDKIEYNTEKPYCMDCFIIWRQFENEEYEEKVCHSCGEPELVNMIKPECYRCFKENN